MEKLPDKVKSGLKTLLNADLILYNAGHLFLSPEGMSSYDILRNDLKTVLPGLLAWRLGIPYGLWGQSVGPFEQKPTFVDKTLLNGAEFIYCRESDSIHNIQSSGIDNENLKVVPDPAFALSINSNGVEDILSSYDIGGKYICLTVRRSGARRGVEIPDEVYYDYIDELASFIDRWSNETSMDVVFVSQHGAKPGYSTKKLVDSNVAKDLRGRLDDPSVLTMVNEDLSIGDLKQLYANSEGLIGTRFHALIFALQVGAPIIGLSSYYTGPKTDGLMKDFGLEGDLFHMEALESEQLYEAAKKFLDTDSRDTHPLMDEYSDGGKNQLEQIVDDQLRDKS